MNLLNFIRQLIQENKELNNTTQFVLHKHEALKAGLHYDLRIKYLDKELLIDFAIPSAKIPTTTVDRQLCIQGDDHEMFNLDFEGNIDSGYGAGKLTILQNGEMIIKKWTNDTISFMVKKGNNKYFKSGILYHLIKLKNDKYGEKSWLLIMSNK